MLYLVFRIVFLLFGIWEGVYGPWTCITCKQTLGPSVVQVWLDLNLEYGPGHSQKGVVPLPW